ncbi:MAG: tRNA pseudouridine(55) synthase TruB, partial [Candidatus Sumerlaeota bacterium]
MSEYHGVLLVDKPAGITSHDVVDRVRKVFGTRRVGHAGTLDPGATGLLVMLLGEATKISEYLIGCDKSYEGTMQLGVVSDTYDAEGEIKPGAGKTLPRKMDDLQEFASDLTGDIDQVPPAYSAKKVAGKKLYEYARQGNVPEIESREITVSDFEILTYEGDKAEFGVDCSSGTYVRSLVHSLGEAAGCGAILIELRRTDVGPFGIEDAHTLENLEI